MRISDWSSDVCSSDLPLRQHHVEQFHSLAPVAGPFGGQDAASAQRPPPAQIGQRQRRRDGIAGGRCGGYPVDRAEIDRGAARRRRSEEHTSELQSLMRISYAVFCLKKKNKRQQKTRQRN